jgi:hypothetical protein
MHRANTNLALLEKEGEGVADVLKGHAQQV